MCRKPQESEEITFGCVHGDTVKCAVSNSTYSEIGKHIWCFSYKLFRSFCQRLVNTFVSRDEDERHGV